MFGKKKKKSEFGECMLCNKQLDANYSPIMQEDTTHELGRICQSCADKLEDIEERNKLDG